MSSPMATRKLADSSSRSLLAAGAVRLRHVERSALRPSSAELARTTTGRSSSTPRRFGESRTTATPGRRLDRAKLRAALDHFTRGRRLARRRPARGGAGRTAAGRRAEPGQRRHRPRAAGRGPHAAAHQGRRRPRGQDRARNAHRALADLAAAGLELPADVSCRPRSSSATPASRDVYTALARFANVNMVFDPQFRDQPITIDLREHARSTTRCSRVSTATRNFYRVTAQRTITVIPDTPAKRREYEEEIVRTFYLSNADLKETIDLLRIVVDARRIAPVDRHQRDPIKDTPERMAAAARAHHRDRQGAARGRHRRRAARSRPHAPARVRPADSRRPDRPGIDGSVDVNRDAVTLRDLRNLTQSDVFLTNLPALFYRLLKTDSNTRTLANPQLRTSEGMPAQARFGERVPGPGHDLRADRHRRRGPAADHVVQLREHRREHRHHAAHASRRRGVAGAEGRGQQHLGDRLRRPARRSATARSTRSSACRTARRTCWPADPRRRAARAGGRPRPERPARSSAGCSRTTQTRDAGDRHRPDADAAHRPRARLDARRTCGRSASAATATRRRAASIDLPVVSRRSRQPAATAAAGSRRRSAGATGRTPLGRPPARRRGCVNRPAVDAALESAKPSDYALAVYSDLRDLRAERLQPLDELAVAALDGLERRHARLPVRGQAGGDQRHARPQIAAVEHAAAAQLASGR